MDNPFLRLLAIRAPFQIRAVQVQLLTLKVYEAAQIIMTLVYTRGRKAFVLPGGQFDP